MKIFTFISLIFFVGIISTLSPAKSINKFVVCKTFTAVSFSPTVSVVVNYFVEIRALQASLILGVSSITLKMRTCRGKAYLCTVNSYILNCFITNGGLKKAGYIFFCGLLSNKKDPLYTSILRRVE